MLSCMVQTFAGELICIWNYITITEHKCSICQLQGDERGEGSSGVLGVVGGSDSNSCSAVQHAAYVMIIDQLIVQLSKGSVCCLL